MGFLIDVKGIFRSYQGRHFTSRWIRKIVERGTVKQWLGYHLATATFVVAMVDPISSSAALNTTPAPTVSPEPLITANEVKTETTLAWPVINHRLTQGFHIGHPGIDIQGDLSIYPIDKGWVSDIIYDRWGYGSHVLVEHPNGRRSLYAHLNKIEVKKGQEVTRETELGIMGRTGWATGIHLHLEIYQDGKVLSPLAVLPAK